MAARRRKKDPETAEAKLKKVSVKLVPREHKGETTTIYRMLDWLIEEHFPELSDARFAIMWNLAPPREDADGQATIYSVKKCSDKDRETASYDFVITICHETFNKKFKDDQMVAMMHEALCFCGVQRDKNGEPKEDELGRTVYRTRKPIKTFKENIAIFGPWRSSLSDTMEAAAAFNDSKRPLFNFRRDMSKVQKAPGFSEPANGNGKVNGKAKEAEPALSS